jgi:hypothetical protein
MKEIVLKELSIRTAPVTSRAADFAPVAPACCNVCRTCTTSNVIGLALGAGAAMASAMRQLLRRA